MLKRIEFCEFTASMSTKCTYVNKNAPMSTKMHQCQQKSKTIISYFKKVPGHIAQSVTCLTANPGVASLIPVRSHTFADIDHKIICTAILLSSADSTDSRRVVVSNKRKYVLEVLVNRFVKLAKGKGAVLVK